MRTLLAWTLVSLGGVGLAMLTAQLWALRRHLRRRPPAPRRALAPGISVLKPLCGVDDDLEALLEAFARLDYPRYELLLGVRDRGDAAYPLAVAAARRHPGRVRVVLQQGAPGLNPKVNQLCTLARAARHDLLVVSDSNVRARAGYLREIAAWFEDERVGVVTHPIVGVGEARLGAWLDNLHMTTSIGAGMVAAATVKRPVVVGKSMALRRADLQAIGGFDLAANVLAEDYFLGVEIARRLGKRAVVGHTPVENVTRSRPVREFWRRYRRWSVLHRRQVGLAVYSGELLLNPVALAGAGALLAGSAPALAAAGGAMALRAGLDAVTLRLLRGRRVGLLELLLASPLRDALLLAAWADGLFRRSVEWRGNRLRVLAGTRIEAPAAANDQAQADVVARVA